MNSRVVRFWPMRWLLAVCVGLFLVACAGVGGPKLVVHAFNFDGRHDGWADQVDLLAFSYGDQYRMTQNSVERPRSEVFRGRSSLPAAEGVNGLMPIGEFLSVKWRLKASGEVVEERVDLRDRLPRDMTNHQLTFVIDGRQLYVYVVTPRVQAVNVKQRTHRTWLSRYNATFEIFPGKEAPPEGK
jgi:hypothetical protein